MARTQSPIIKHPAPLAISRPYQDDDLTQIRGIGTTIARRLKVAGISTYAQLADLSPIEIARRVPGLSVTRIRHEGWSRQARKFSSHRSNDRGRAQAKSARYHGQSYETFTVEFLMNDDRTVRRTHVTYIQGKREQKWGGWEVSGLVSFMVQFAAPKLPALESDQMSQPDTVTGLTLAPEMKSSSSSDTPLPSSPPGKSKPRFEPSCPAPLLEINSSPDPQDALNGTLCLDTLEFTALDADFPLHAVRVGDRIKCRLGLDFTKVIYPRHEPLNYDITIRAKKLGSKLRQVVGGRRGTLMPATKAPYTLEVTLPSQGTYRLEAIVALTQEDNETQPPPRLLAMRTSGLMQVY